MTKRKNDDKQKRDESWPYAAMWDAVSYNAHNVWAQMQALHWHITPAFIVRGFGQDEAPHLEPVPESLDVSSVLEAHSYLRNMLIRALEEIGMYADAHALRQISERPTAQERTP